MYDREHRLYLRKIRLNKLLIHIVQFLIIVVFIFLWEYLSGNGIINSFIYSSPSKAMRTIYGLYLEGNLFNHILVTVYETFISFSLATVIGTLIAIMLWYSKFLYKVLEHI